MNKRTVYLIISIGLLCLTILPLGYVLGATLKSPIDSKDFSSLLGKIAEAVGGLVASLCAVAFAIAGIMYIVSTANPDLRAMAKKALIYAFVGAVLGLSATAIVGFVKTTVGGGGGGGGEVQAPATTDD